MILGSEELESSVVCVVQKTTVLNIRFLFFVAAVLSVLTHPHFLPSHNLPLVRPCRPLAVAEPEQPDPRPGDDDDSVRRWLLSK